MGMDRPLSLPSWTGLDLPTPAHCTLADRACRDRCKHLQGLAVRPALPLRFPVHRGRGHVAGVGGGRGAPQPPITGAAPQPGARLGLCMHVVCSASADHLCGMRSLRAGYCAQLSPQSCGPLAGVRGLTGDQHCKRSWLVPAEPPDEAPSKRACQVPPASLGHRGPLPSRSPSPLARRGPRAGCPSSSALLWGDSQGLHGPPAPPPPAVWQVVARDVILAQLLGCHQPARSQCLAVHLQRVHVLPHAQRAGEVGPPGAPHALIAPQRDQ